MTRDVLCSKFLDSLTHPLYPYQEEALLAWFSQNGGVLVAAPTGMGKTLIAEAAVFEALHTQRRMYYTTPLIALTDQKFREFQALAERWGFPREQIGLITGNRRENPDAIVRVVVAEILLNHLLAGDPASTDLGHTTSSGQKDADALSSKAGQRGLPPSPFGSTDAVVMDEFHSFNDPERGVVWELSLALLPQRVRVLLLSATVGNPAEFCIWLQKEHGRNVQLVTSTERRVPLEYVWVEDKLLTELLPAMATAVLPHGERGKPVGPAIDENASTAFRPAEADDATNRTPALVFCFNRDECWELAERLKGLPLIAPATRTLIDAFLDERRDDLTEGIGPKLRQMLTRGVAVHHAGVLPKHKHIVEELFNRKLVPFVVCTETLAAGINLPARSVVLTTLIKGKRGEKKLVPPASAHQMFGRAGRPQFDTKGYVYAVAHEDDVRILKWKEKFDKLDPKSKDLGIMKARKELERKKPTRRRTEQYWMQGHFNQLIAAGPAKLFSRSMIPYSVLIFLLTRTGALHDVRGFLSRRFNDSDHIAKFQQQLDFMLGNLAALGYLRKADDGDHVTLNDGIYRLLGFRSIDPLYGMFLVEQLVRSDYIEKILVLESVLEIPPAIERFARIPEDLPEGPLQREVLAPLMIQMGVVVAKTAAQERADQLAEDDFWAEEEERPPTFPEMLKLVFESKLASPEPVFVQPKWLAGGAFDMDCDFYKFVKSRDLSKQEGLILRHLLRLVILAGEFFTLSEDPDYQRISALATQCCRRVDPTYTDRFLAEQEAIKKTTALA